jgi:hypothetical protein
MAAAGIYPLTFTATAGVDILTLSRTVVIQEAAISYIEVIRQRPLTTATLVGSVVGYLAATTTVPALSALSLGLIRNQSEL